MTPRIAIVGAGISGLTTGVVLAERGHAPQLVAALPAERSTSGAAAAIWYPYEAAPQDMAWALITYGRLLELQREESSGVTLTEIRCFSRNDGLAPPAWASAIGVRMLAADELLPVNEVTDDEAVDPAATERIIAECARALHPLLQSPPRWKESRVGLRPFRAAGVRLEAERLPDGRLLVHNYGHSGAGFTLSWGCAHKVAELIAAEMTVGAERRAGGPPAGPPPARRRSTRDAPASRRRTSRRGRRRAD